MSREAGLDVVQSIGDEKIAYHAKPLSTAPAINGHAEATSESPEPNSRDSTLEEESLELSLRESLVQMIRRLSPNAALRQDLLQEALIHLWRTGIRRPGQTRSWYIQSCRFHLHHYLNSGRSIDSTKRWRDQLPLTDDSEDAKANEQADSGNSIFTCVNAREIMSLLEPHLTRQEQAVLVCLAEGLGPREIGRKLNLSHTMAIRHRRKIALILTQLDSQGPEKTEPSQINGAPQNGCVKTRTRTA
jgi:RNA polymerase sigma factor (sigma-70 family)